MMIDYLRNQGYFMIKKIPNQGVCCLMKFLFTTGLIIDADLNGYEGRYCYETIEEAIQAILEWNGEGDPPGNWIKYKGKGGERTNKNLKQIFE